MVVITMIHIGSSTIMPIYISQPKEGSITVKMLNPFRVILVN